VTSTFFTSPVVVVALHKISTHLESSYYRSLSKPPALKDSTGQKVIYAKSSLMCAANFMP
jgi:hypothetical protein